MKTMDEILLAQVEKHKDMLEVLSSWIMSEWNLCHQHENAN